MLSGQCFFSCTKQSSAQWSESSLRTNEKSLSSRKEAPQEPFPLEMFEHREQTSSEVLAALTFIFSVIADWFFCTLCCVELSVWFSFKHSISQGMYTCALCSTYLSHRIKLNCSCMGSALYSPTFSFHKMDIICDFNVLLFQEPDFVPLPVTRSRLRILEDCKYSILSTFWTGSRDNLPIPFFSSFTRFLLLTAAHNYSAHLWLH